jgi:sialic acid synthase SpsE
MKIIADLGSNFVGYPHLKNAIHLAKAAGADAIKYQLYSEEELYGFGSSEYNFNPAWIPLLVLECEDHKIEFMCTIFSHKKVKMLSEHVKTFKVASSDMCYVELLKEIDKTGKPVIVSMGSHKEKEIEHALHLLNRPRVTLLYCEAAYPAKEINVGMIPILHNKFRVPVGLSDHSQDVITIPLAAKNAGAVVIEKHFNPFDLSTPDSGHALNLRQFTKMCNALKDNLKIVNVEPTTEEADMLLKYNRRAIAIKDIKKGDELVKWENFGMFRSKKPDATGGHAFSEYNGKIAPKDYKQGDAIYL